METLSDILEQPIKTLIDAHPPVGEILERYGVGCVDCGVGTCLTRDIVAIHNLDPDTEQAMMREVAGAVFPGRTVDIPRREVSDAGETDPSALSPPMRKLMDEHGYIKRWAALIPRLVEGLDLESDGGRERVLAGVAFIRSYADKFHHAKEESILFDFFDASLDILKVMLEDHETARSHVLAVLEALEKRDREAVGSHLMAYAALLNEHIKKEDEILFPWMDRQLTDPQVGRLFARFAEVDRQFGDEPRRHETFIEQLEAEFASAPRHPEAGSARGRMNERTLS